MGSGHFLVAAVDRIERRLSEFLAVNRIPGVHAELKRLAEAAGRNLAAVGIVSEATDTILRTTPSQKGSEKPATKP